MGTREVHGGPVHDRLPSQLRALRDSRGLSLTGLSEASEQLGRPMLRTAFAKIEAGERRVDVDDVVCLALALGVTPNRLLLGDQPGAVPLAPRLTVPADRAWAWADGRMPLNDTDDARGFRTRNRPLEPPEPSMVGLSEQQRGAIVDAHQALRRAAACGIPPETVVALGQVLDVLDAGHTPARRSRRS